MQHCAVNAVGASKLKGKVTWCTGSDGLTSVMLPLFRGSIRSIGVPAVTRRARMTHQHRAVNSMKCGWYSGCKHKADHSMKAVSPGEYTIQSRGVGAVAEMAVREIREPVSRIAASRDALCILHDPHKTQGR